MLDLLFFSERWQIVNVDSKINDKGPERSFGKGHIYTWLCVLMKLIQVNNS